MSFVCRFILYYLFCSAPQLHTNEMKETPFKKKNTTRKLMQNGKEKKERIEAHA